MKYILELPGQFGDSRTIGFANLSKVIGLENWEGFCFLCFKFPGVALFNLSNLHRYAMMQCKAKSEKLAHILGYQTGAVTATLRR